MKKLLLLATSALLFTGFAFAGNGGDKEKDKKKEKAKTTKTCPGKTCGKKKD